MRRVIVRTKINKSPSEVIKHINAQLYYDLTPPFIKLEITRFDGIYQGGETNIIASLLGYYQNWKFKISDFFESSKCSYYRDQALEMPSPFKFYSYTHRIDKLSESRIIIIDEVTYQTSNILLDFLVYPIIFAMLYYRKPIYIDRYHTKNE